jgi:CheY-like chemotaxis protein
VLVADDNGVNRKVLQRLLGDHGALVDPAFDGEQAVAMAASGVYELVLMDVSMPRLNGYDATARIRAATLPSGFPAPWSRVPVLGVTAFAMQADLDRCIASGMNGYVRKPLERELLMAAIAAVLPQPVSEATAEGA